MRNFILLLSVVFFISCNHAENKFIVQGEFEDLQIGDTVFITNYTLPYWEEIWIDTIITNQEGKFFYDKELEHTSHLLLNYQPKDRELPESPVRGIVLFARNGDNIQLKGTSDYFSAPYITGGIYEDSLVNKMTTLEREYHLQLTEIYRNLVNAREEENKEKMQHYSDMYNRHPYPQEVIEISKHFTYEVNDSEYAAYNYLQRLSDEDYKDIEKRFESFTPQVQNSHMGKLVGDMAVALKNIGVGNQPNNFKVVDNNGNTIQLSDYKDNYLLIYHWGLCPGTIWVQPLLLELYEEYKDRNFEILGFTFGDFAETYPDFANNKETQETVELLTNQPWTTVYTEQEENKFIKNELYFMGVPLFMLISPDGTTLVRGYSDVYEDVKNILEENL